MHDISINLQSRRGQGINRWQRQCHGHKNVEPPIERQFRFEFCKKYTYTNIYRTGSLYISCIRVYISLFSLLQKFFGELPAELPSSNGTSPNLNIFCNFFFLFLLFFLVILFVSFDFFCTFFFVNFFFRFVQRIVLKEN